MCSLQLYGDHELKLNTEVSLSFNLKALVWEDEKTDSSQGGRDFLNFSLFFNLSRLRVMALNMSFL